MHLFVSGAGVKPLRADLERSHPAVDTFERVLERGVVVDQVSSADPTRMKRHRRVNVSIAGFEVFGGEQKDPRPRD